METSVTLHATFPKLDDEAILLLRPPALLLPGRSDGSVDKTLLVLATKLDATGSATWAGGRPRADAGAASRGKRGRSGLMDIRGRLV